MNDRNIRKHNNHGKIKNFTSYVTYFLTRMMVHINSVQGV